MTVANIHHWPMRAVVKITRSPLNKQRWQLHLACGHTDWITAKKKPTRGVSTCGDCAQESLR